MLKLVLFATHPEGYFNILIKQIKQLGYKNVKILGWNEKWQGFHKRTIDFYNYFLTLDDDDIVLCLDAFDTLLLRRPNDILKKYKSFNSEVVWSVENTDFISKLLFKSNYNYTLNGGMYIGKNKYLKIIFQELINRYGIDFNQDDQKLINKLNNQWDYFHEIVKPDIHGYIFSNIAYCSPIYKIYDFLGKNVGEEKLTHSINDGRIVNKNTNIEPSIISGPGNISLKHFIPEKYVDEIIPRDKYKEFALKNFSSDFFWIFFCTFVLIFIIIYIIYKLK